MEADIPLREAYDEVLRKTGRNLLLFQQAERLIKSLLTFGNSAFSASDPRTFDEHGGIWQKQTLGQISNQFVDHHCMANPRSADGPCVPASDGASDRTTITFHFTLGGTANHAETRKQELAELVAERNDLVHHLLARLNRDSLESCIETARHLDEQRMRILPAIQHLQQNLNDICEVFESTIDRLADPKGLAELLLPEIQQSPLIRNLATIAAETTTPAGWMRLGEATKRIQDFPQEKIKVHLDQFHQKSLTDLLVASKLFEIRLEPTECGRPRVLYRLKHGMPQPPSSFTWSPDF